MNSVVSIKSPADIAKSREAGQLAASVLQMIAPHVKAGVTTEELDQRCHDYIVHELKVIPANVGTSSIVETPIPTCHSLVVRMVRPPTDAPPDPSGTARPG